MNYKTAIPLGVAIVLGVVAAILARKVTTPRVITSTDGSHLQSLAVAARPIPPGTALTPDMITIVRVDPQAMPDGAFGEVDPLVDRVVRSELARGQAILLNSLAPSGSGAGLQALVPPGMRAITIQIDEFSGLAGMIRPGDRVDLVARVPGENDESFTRAIVQNIPVLAVGQRIGNDTDSANNPGPQMPRSVTLLVSPVEAQQIDLAVGLSTARLVLRGYGDAEEFQSNGTTFADLRGPAFESRIGPMRAINQDVFADAPARPIADVPPRPKATRSITIIRNGVESVETVAEPAHTGGFLTNTNTDPLD